MKDIFDFVKEEQEEVLYKYGNTEAKLKDCGLKQFFLPGTLAGLFLCVASTIFIQFASNDLTLGVARATSALGGMIIASSMLFYAMFLRQARRAHGNFLYITSKNAIWWERGRYAKMPLAEITDARVGKGERLGAVPFDMSMLEGECLILFYRGADMKIPFIENPEDAARKIKSLVG